MHNQCIVRCSRAVCVSLAVDLILLHGIRHKQQTDQLSDTTQSKKYILSDLHYLFSLTTVGQLLFAPWAWAYSTLHP